MLYEVITIGPALEELAVQYEGKIKIAKVNVDENPASPAMMGVRGIPTLFMFKDGQVISHKVGAAPKAALESWITVITSYSIHYTKLYECARACRSIRSATSKR